MTKLDLPTLKLQRAWLSVFAHAIIDIRGVLAIIGKMIVLLRNVAIRRS